MIVINELSGSYWKMSSPQFHYKLSLYHKNPQEKKLIRESVDILKIDREDHF